jgi:outer membrane protein assembly factor BamB
MRTALVMVMVLMSLGAVPAGGQPSTDSELIALSATDGAVRWGAQPTKLPDGARVVAASDDLVYVVQGRCFWDDDAQYHKGSSALAAFDARTGKERWRVEDVGTGEGLLVPTLGTLPPWVSSMQPNATIPITSPAGDTLLGLSARDGSRAWKLPLHELRAVAGDGAAYVLTTGPFGASPIGPVPAVARTKLVNAKSGKTAWSTLVGNDTAIVGAALTGTSVALVVRAADSSGNRLVLLNRRTGKVVSDTPLRDYVGTALEPSPGVDSMGAAGDVLVVSTGRAAIAADAQDGHALWHRDDYRQGGSLAATTKDGTPVLFLSHWVFGSNTSPDRTEAIDARSNRTLWTVPNGYFVPVAQGTRSVSMPDSLWHSFGTGSVVESATGKVRWTSDLSDDQRLLLTPRSLYVSGGCPITLRD